MEKKLSHIIIFVTILFIESCSCRWDIDVKYIPQVRRVFIDTILKDPANIKSIIDNSKYYSKKERSNFIINDTLDSYISYIKNCFSDGYTYIYFDNLKVSNEDILDNAINYYEEIKIKSNSKNYYLNFYFTVECNKMVLHGIDREEKNLVQRSRTYKNNIERVGGDD